MNDTTLKGRRILLGVTGSIAAYKAALLVRGLVKEGADVQVVMTPLAKQFITPLTMATLSRHPILVEFFDPENGAWNSHVSLGEWADLYLIAPATANTLASYLVYVRQSAMPINRFTQQINFLLAALSGAERIFEMMNQEPEIDDGNVTL